MKRLFLCLFLSFYCYGSQVDQLLRLLKDIHQSSATISAPRSLDSFSPVSVDWSKVKLGTAADALTGLQPSQRVMPPAAMVTQPFAFEGLFEEVMEVDGVSVVQVPVASQTGLLCGSHALKNALYMMLSLADPDQNCFALMGEPSDHFTVFTDEQWERNLRAIARDIELTPVEEVEFFQLRKQQRDIDQQREEVISQYEDHDPLLGHWIGTYGRAGLQNVLSGTMENMLLQNLPDDVYGQRLGALPQPYILTLDYANQLTDDRLIVERVINFCLNIADTETGQWVFTINVSEEGGHWMSLALEKKQGRQKWYFMNSTDYVDEDTIEALIQAVNQPKEYFEQKRESIIVCSPIIDDLKVIDIKLDVLEHYDDDHVYRYYAGLYLIGEEITDEQLTQQGVDLQLKGHFQQGVHNLIQGREPEFRHFFKQSLPGKFFFLYVNRSNTRSFCIDSEEGDYDPATGELTPAGQAAFAQRLAIMQAREYIQYQVDRKSVFRGVKTDEKEAAIKLALPAGGVLAFARDIYNKFGDILKKVTVYGGLSPRVHDEIATMITERVIRLRAVVQAKPGVVGDVTWLASLIGELKGRKLLKVEMMVN